MGVNPLDQDGTDLTAKPATPTLRFSFAVGFAVDADNDRYADLLAQYMAAMNETYDLVRR